MGSNISKNQKRLQRKKRIRKKVFGTQLRPRLNVFRSAKHIYAQIIDDTCGHTIVAASTIEKDFTTFSSAVEGQNETTAKKISEATLVGKLIAERALEKGIKQVVYDRNGYIYHGRVKAVSDGARKAGLDF